MLQAGRSPLRVPDEVDFFKLPNPSSRTMGLGSTQPLTKISTINLTGGKTRPARKADNSHLWAECLKMWELQPLATLRAYTACIGITLPPLQHFLPVLRFILWRNRPMRELLKFRNLKERDCTAVAERCRVLSPLPPLVSRFLALLGCAVTLAHSPHVGFQRL
jgi:hypothetical protein